MDETLDKLLDLLRDKHIPKGKFLADLGFDRSALSEWVKGRHKSYMKRLPDIAAYFGVSLDWLAGNEQKNKPSDNFGELSQAEIDLLHAFRKLNDNGQDMILRAAGVDPDSIKPEDKK